MKRVMMLVAVAGGIVQMAVGADTHDYSNYARLTSKSTTVTVTTHWPTADQWTPAGEMSADGYYLIPKGKMLYCNSQAATPCDGPWPAAELAVEGAFRSSTTGGRAYTPETAHLAILPGGKIYGTAAYSTFTAETLDVRGTADSPSVIEYSYYANTSKPNYYLLINAVLTSSDSDSVVKFVNPKTADYSFKQRATRILGVRGFLGTVVVEGSNAWVRLETTATEFDLAGTLELKNGGNFYVDTVSPTIGTLKIGAGSTFEVAKKRVVTVTDALELAEGTRILVANPFGDWTTGTPKDPVRIATFGPDVERPSDYRSIFDVPLPSNAVGAIPDIVFSEVENNDGSVDIFVSYREIVDFTGNGSAAVTPFRQTSPDYSKLRDLSPISTEKDYYSLDKSLYVIDWAPTYVYEFLGHSLTLNGTGGKLAVYDGITFVCTNLYLAGSRLTQQKAGSWARFDGNIYAQGGKVAFAGAAGVEIKSDIHGSSDLKMYRAGDTDKEDFTKTSHVYLRGDNSDFSGRFLFGELSWTGGETNHVSELHVWEKANLGGAMPEVTSNGVTIADTCSLVYNGGTETFDEVTRGWTFEGESGLNLVSDVAVKVRNTITVADTLTKRGAGTLVAADVDGAELVIAAGGLGAASPEAFEGLASLTFAAGTKFVVYASADDSLKAAGVDLSATALTVPADGVPVEFTDIPENGANVTVATFATAEDAAKFVFVKPRGYTVKRTVEKTADGQWLLKANIKSGFILVIRGGGSAPAPSIRRVSEFGYDAEDSTAYLQAAIDSGARTVIVDKMAGPWVTRPLTVTRSDLDLVFEDGVTLLAKENEFHGLSDCLVKVKGNVRNVSFRSEGRATLEMRKSDYQDKSRYEPSQWRMALSLADASDVVVSNLTFKSSGGDGLYVNNVSNLVIGGVKCLDNHRQGISVISAHGMLVQDSEFNGTFGNDPESGLDAEPNAETDAFVGITFEDCSFNDNNGDGLQFQFNNLTGASEPVSMTFRRCEIRRSGGAGVYLNGGNSSRIGNRGLVAGDILFDGCTFADASNEVVKVSNQFVGGVRLDFKDCTFDMRGNASTCAAIALVASPQCPRDFGHLQFDNCDLWIDEGRTVLTNRFRAEGYGVTDGLDGTLTVHEGARTSACDFDAFREQNGSDPNRIDYVPASVDWSKFPIPEAGVPSDGSAFPQTRGSFTFVHPIPTNGTYSVRFLMSGEGSGTKRKCVVKNASGTVLKNLSFDGASYDYVFSAERGDVRRFEVDALSKYVSQVVPAMRGCALVANAINLYQSPQTNLYFRVPAAATHVQVSAMPDERGTVELYDAADALREATGDPFRGKVMTVDREASDKDEMWKLAFPIQRGDYVIGIGGDALPFVFKDPD